MIIQRMDLLHKIQYTTSICRTYNIHIDQEYKITYLRSIDISFISEQNQYLYGRTGPIFTGRVDLLRAKCSMVQVARDSILRKTFANRNIFFSIEPELDCLINFCVCFVAGFQSFFGLWMTMSVRRQHFG